MLGNIGSVAHGSVIGRIGGQPQRAESAEASEVRPQAKRASGPEAEADQLRFFLSNITRADASAVIALTQPPRGEASASFDTVASAYGDV
ncbi:MAG: hypothetical protein M9939_11580 [Mesorhizobium sp.]|nr:hypothetical protein [Mesorhizobium sp.]MCO5161772.1 hypothetical protein [Mesorhizobium sp.]